GLDLAGLRRHLAGRVRPAAPARRRMSGPAADAEPHPAASDQELLVALRFEAFASGFWREAGLDVARGIAALVTTDRSRAAPGCAGFGRGATARLDVREEDEDGGDRRAGTGRRDHRRPGAP